MEHYKQHNNDKVPVHCSVCLLSALHLSGWISDCAQYAVDTQKLLTKKAIQTFNFKVGAAATRLARTITHKSKLQMQSIKEVPLCRAREVRVPIMSSAASERQHGSKILKCLWLCALCHPCWVDFKTRHNQVYKICFLSAQLCDTLSCRHSLPYSL